MTKTKSGWKIDSFFVLIIFCIFITSALMSLILGAAAYKNIIDRSYEGQDERICLSYVCTKIKNADNKVYVGDFYGQSALFITKEYEGVVYRTAIYLYDGWVCELFSETGLEFLPEDGMPVIEAENLVFEEMENGLIEVTVNSQSLLILPRVNSGGRRSL